MNRDKRLKALAKGMTRDEKLALAKAEDLREKMAEWRKWGLQAVRQSKAGVEVEPPDKTICRI